MPLSTSLRPAAAGASSSSSSARRSRSNGSLQGPTRRSFQPAILAVSLVALSAAGIVHTVGLEPVGRSGASGPPRAGDAFTEELRESVYFQAEEVGRRTSRYSPHQDALEDYLREAIVKGGLRLTEHDYTVGSVSGRNFIGVLPGRGPGAVLVGTHFDSLGKSPCANATATAVAAVAGLVSELRGQALERTVLFAFFDNGERPNRGKATAGSQAWLDHFEGEEARAELLPLGGELELALLVGSFGSWSDHPGSHPADFPWSLATSDVADWVGVFGALGERDLAADFLARWARHSELPARGFALPSWTPGVPVGDEGPFREASIPTLFISDTGRQRTPQLRTSQDHPYELNYGAMALRVRALAAVVADVAGR